jgi:hypothetical protein
MPRTVTPQPTPNPNAIRFAVGGNAFGDKSRSFPNAASAAGAPWAERLFGLPGVVGLFAVKDFVTITKAPAADWHGIVPRAVEILGSAELTPAGG